MSRAVLRAARAATAAPLVAGGAGVVLVMAGVAGRWGGLVVAAWLAAAGLLLTPAAEQAGVRLLDGYRAPAGGDRELLVRLHAAAAARAGPHAPPARLYVRPRVGGVNAYATGRRSIAVSGGFLPAVRSGALSERHASAVLVHEMGHLADGWSRFGLVAAWLSLPWRTAAAVVGGLLRGIVGHVPTARTGLLLAPLVAVVAGVQAVRAHAWGPLAVLVWLAVVLVVQPVAAAALARAGERAADRYAVAHGAGADLAAALRAGPEKAGIGRPGWRAVWATHPRIEQRIRQLAAPAVATP